MESLAAGLKVRDWQQKTSTPFAICSNNDNKRKREKGSHSGKNICLNAGMKASSKPIPLDPCCFFFEHVFAAAAAASTSFILFIVSICNQSIHVETFNSNDGLAAGTLLLAYRNFLWIRSKWANKTEPQNKSTHEQCKLPTRFLSSDYGFLQWGYVGEPFA